MFFIVFAVVLLLVMLGGLLFAFGAKRLEGFVVAGIAVLVLLVSTGFASATTVAPRSVGIVTSFGKYRETLSPGLHFTAPWANTEQFETTLQSADLEGETGVNVTFSQGERIDPVTKKPIKIIAGGGKGSLHSFARWRIDEGTNDNGAKALWEKYRTFDRVNRELVQREFYDALANTANDYEAGVAVVSQDEIAAKVKARLAERVAPYGIVIDGVSVTAVSLDGPTQQAVDKIYQSEQEIKTATNRKSRAVIDAETVELQRKAGALSKDANQKFCLDVINNWDTAKNGALPATLNCNFGGADANVLVGAGK